MGRNAYAAHTEKTQERPKPCSDHAQAKRPHLRSVLSAREMAGFLTALLQAALLLQERPSQCCPRGKSGSP